MLAWLSVWSEVQTCVSQLPLSVSCFSKIQIGFTFLVLAHPGSPRLRAVKRVCVCVLVGDLLVERHMSHPIYQTLGSVIYDQIFQAVMEKYMWGLWYLQVNLQTAAQHAELMRKVETLNLLQDSNHLLRDERNRLSARLQEIEATVSACLLLWKTRLSHFYVSLCALTLLVRERPACKNWMMQCWHGYLSGARCRLFACVPADATTISKSN